MCCNGWCLSIKLKLNHLMQEVFCFLPMRSKNWLLNLWVRRPGDIQVDNKSTYLSHLDLLSNLLHYECFVTKNFENRSFFELRNPKLANCVLRNYGLNSKFKEHFDQEKSTDTRRGQFNDATRNQISTAESTSGRRVKRRKRKSLPHGHVQKFWIFIFKINFGIVIGIV